MTVNLTRLLVIMLFAACAGPNSASAAFYTGNDMHRFCLSKKPDELSLCVGYIIGYFEAMQINMTCKRYSEKITGGQLVDVVEKFLIEKPDQRHMPAAWIVGRSLVVAFDCRQNEEISIQK